MSGSVQSLSIDIMIDRLQNRWGQLARVKQWRAIGALLFALSLAGCSLLLDTDSLLIGNQVDVGVTRDGGTSASDPDLGDSDASQN